MCEPQGSLTSCDQSLWCWLWLLTLWPHRGQTHHLITHSHTHRPTRSLSDTEMSRGVCFMGQTGHYVDLSVGTSAQRNDHLSEGWHTSLKGIPAQFKSKLLAQFFQLAIPVIIQSWEKLGFKLQLRHNNHASPHSHLKKQKNEHLRIWFRIICISK